MAEEIENGEEDLAEPLAERLKKFALDVELTRRAAAKKGTLLPATKKPSSMVEVGLLLVDRYVSLSFI
jgi:hypothetical protein